jgi:hypothetical protein
MQNSNECTFDRELRATVEKYSNDGLLSAGEIVAVLEVVKHATLHAAENAAADDEVDNFTSTNTASLKFPLFNDVWDYIARLPEPKTNNELRNATVNMVREVYNYIKRELQA